MKNKRLLSSFSFIHSEYVKEAEPKMKTSSKSPLKALGRVACFILAVALGLYLFIPFSQQGPDLTAYQSSEYFPIIERIADYRYYPNPYKNNFQAIVADIGDFFDSFGSLAKGDATAPAPEDGADMNGSPNGNYQETTDNQVNGVVEADLMKRTDKYIFRLGRGKLRVYSIEKEATKCVAEFKIPVFADEYSERYHEREMYLSTDARTITLIAPYTTKEYGSRIRIISIDVSDLANINIKKTVSIDGSYNSSRMVDGKLLLITEYRVNGGTIDYEKPETYVPSITENDVTSCIKFEDIIYPDELGSTRYSVVALLDEDTLELKKANALLDFYNDIYVSNNNVYVTKEYSTKTDIDENNSYKSVRMTDVVVLGYEGETLENKGILTVEGEVKDQYSMDEYEGHFRVVTSTREQTVTENRNGRDVVMTDDIPVSNRLNLSASLTVFNLESMEKIAEVKNFAPTGESVSSVRFDGSTAYVCTAVVQTFTDPVFFFDLSDYSNITYTGTGVIDGFSSSLIQLGDGFLLGIGEKDWQYRKIEVYEERDGEVVSVAEYCYTGLHATDYKAYFIDRENDMFGFYVTSEYDPDLDYYDRTYYDAYVLLHFNGYELIEVVKINMNRGYNEPDRIRSFTCDGYLYITTDDSIEVINITE